MEVWRGCGCGGDRYDPGRISELAPRHRGARREQAGADGAAVATLDALARGNFTYEQRFGHVFLISATGKTADEMLGALRGRLSNDPATELRVAAEEQAKITRLRLDKLVAS